MFRSTTPPLPVLVLHCTLLLLAGPHVATAAAVAIVVIQTAIGERSPRRWLACAGDAGAAAAAIHAAGWVYAATAGAFGPAWPWAVVPLAALATSWCAVASAAAALPPMLAARRWNGGAAAAAWLEAWPAFVVGTSLGAVLGALIVRRAWELLPAAAIPAYIVIRLFRERDALAARARLHGEVLESLPHGVCRVDAGGRVTVWNETLARMLECSREQAVGRPLRAVRQSLADSDLPRAVAGTLSSRTRQLLPNVTRPGIGGGRIFDVVIQPAGDGAVLVWEDVTARTHADQTRRRHEERLELAADGAQDGLWEWDFRKQELFVTRRWRVMLGLDGASGIVAPQVWLDRVHPDDLPRLKEALQACLSGNVHSLRCEHRIRHEDGTYRSVLASAVVARGRGTRAVRMAGSLSDVTDRAAAEERLRSAAHLDPLTGLSNRGYFVERLGRRLQEAKQRRASERFAVLYLDLDRFKVVNDSLGHMVGDELLVAVSRRLEGCLREGDVLARLGGDEFAILLSGLQTEQQANVIAFRVQEVLAKPFEIAGRSVFTSASIGIALGGTHYTTPDQMMHDADTAMYQAKAGGKARHEVFDADMHARVRDRVGLENDLRRAITERALEIQYQPIVSLGSRMCVGFESLVRWTRNGEAVSPATFIPMAEELGLIEPLGRWVLEEVCRAFAAWRQRFPDAGLECITVNVSPRQLVQQDFVSAVERIVQESGLQPVDLRIEITETALMASPSAAAEVLAQLREFGVKIYLDDFGTGYSSLTHLHKLPVDALKIDRTFVRSLLLPDRPAIVESILALARTLNTSVVAEGVETEVQATELERLGCTHAQGFFFSRPLSAPAIEELLGAQHPLGPRRMAAAGGGRAQAQPPVVEWSGLRRTRRGEVACDTPLIS